MSYRENVQDFLKLIRKDRDLIIKSYEFNKKPADAEHIKKSWSPHLRAFYNELNGFTLRWKHFDYQDTPHIRGAINILPSIKVLGSWEGIVFYHPSLDDKIKKFQILDFFVDESAVGFYDIPGHEEELYLYAFEGMPAPLNVDLDGYLKLMFAAKGFRYWQKTLLVFNGEEESQESLDFRDYMPKLFSEFNFAEFEQLYQSVKLR